MISVRFGIPIRQLVGFYHPPTAAESEKRDYSILLCNPFGQEAIRSHRLIRLLAERLARVGFSVLRFDYYATGDSPGADEEADIDGWIGDVLSAHAELERLSGNSSCAWLGLRLGGAIALQASSKIAHALDKIVLWDPVVDGEGYLDEIGKAHIEAIKLSYGARFSTDEKFRQVVIAESRTEAMGFPLTKRLRDQIAAFSAASLTVINASCINIFSGNLPEPSVEFLRALKIRGINCEFTSVTTEVNWAANEMMNSTLVPVEMLDALVASLSARS